MATPLPIIVNNTLYELCNSFMNCVEQVYTLPSDVHTCLGAISPTVTSSTPRIAPMFPTGTEPKARTARSVIVHIRPHDFLNVVPFECNLQSMLRYPDLHGVTSISCVVYAFMECIRKHLCKEKVYWKIIDAEPGSFEVYV